MSRRAALALGVGLVGASGTLALAPGRDAAAQAFDPRRGAELVVGQAAIPCALDRLDDARSGRASVAVGRVALRPWLKGPRRLRREHADRRRADGCTCSNRGQAVWSGRRRGARRGRRALELGGASTSDGTIVGTTGGGQAVGLRGGQRALRIRLGAGASPPSPRSCWPTAARSSSPAATPRCSDARGGALPGRAPEPVAHPPLVGRDELLLVDDKGVVRAWTPGKVPRRVGASGGVLDACPARTARRAGRRRGGRPCVRRPAPRTSTPRATPLSGALLLDHLADGRRRRRRRPRDVGAPRGPAGRSRGRRSPAPPRGARAHGRRRGRAATPRAPFPRRSSTRPAPWSSPRRTEGSGSRTARASRPPNRSAGRAGGSRRSRPPRAASWSPARTASSSGSTDADAPPASAAPRPYGRRGIVGVAPRGGGPI